MRLDYRTEEEIDSWRARDPLDRFVRRLVEAGIWDDGDRARVDAEVEVIIEEAVAFARSSPFPDLEDAFLHQYATEYPGMPARGWT